MPDRYQRRPRRVNEEDLYDNLFEERGLKKVVQYETPILPAITAQMRSSLTRQKNIWKTNDSYQKLAQAFYGDARYWWVLAWYNGKPTDALVKIGDTIRIPLPLERILGFMEI